MIRLIPYLSHLWRLFICKGRKKAMGGAMRDNKLRIFKGFDDRETGMIQIAIALRILVYGLWSYSLTMVFKCWILGFHIKKGEDANVFDTNKCL